MSTLKNLTVCAAVLGALALAACKGGPEGSYKLDKSEMK
jgi:hypothetical protein